VVLYHGSQYLIKKPYYGGGRAANDYGRGFYCTESESLACEWAVSDRHDGYANCYEFSDDALSVLDLNSSDYTILHWLAVLLRHRTFDVRYGVATLARQYLLENFSVDVEAYDVVRGYRADDSYFSFAQDFISGTISYPQLATAMRLGKLGEQVVIKSKRAFGRLKFLSAKVAVREEWLDLKESRDASARRDYFDMRKTPYRLEDLSIQQIMRERIVPGDPRIR
jgi:hypothetical protein